MGSWSAPPRHADVKSRIQTAPGHSADYLGKVGDYEVIRLAERGWHEPEGQSVIVKIGRKDAIMKMERLNDLTKWTAFQTGETPKESPRIVKRAIKWTKVMAFLIEKRRLNQMVALARTVTYTGPYMKEGQTMKISLTL